MIFQNRKPQAHQPASLEDYVFDNPVTLHAGRWNLRIEKGDAWIFCNRGNFPLTTTQSMHFEPSDGDILIRRLYVKSIVKFHAMEQA